MNSKEVIHLNDISYEQRLFLQLLADYLHQRHTVTDKKIEWNKLFGYADKHQMTAIIAHQIRTSQDSIEDVEINRLITQCSSIVAKNVYSSVNRNKLYQSMISQLDEHGINYIPLKGIVLQECYWQPMYRTMGDVDLAMSANDQLKAKPIMNELGFALLGESDVDATYKKSVLEVEMHEKLCFFENNIQNQVKCEYFNSYKEHIIDTKTGNYLDWNFHILYLFHHLSGHLTGSGVGFRQFYDIAFLLKRKQEEFDWEYIKNIAESLGILKFIIVCLELCHRWFGTDNPLPTINLDDDFFTEATKRIFSNGVFGFGNNDNSANGVIRTINKSKKKLLAAKINSAVKLVFPKYDDLIRDEKYSHLRKAPYLLPIVWIKRAISSFSNGTYKRVGTLLSMKKKDIESKQDELKKWGLLDAKESGF